MNRQINFCFKHLATPPIFSVSNSRLKLLHFEHKFILSTIVSSFYLCITLFFVIFSLRLPSFTTTLYHILLVFFSHKYFSSNTWWCMEPSIVLLCHSFSSCGCFSNNMFFCFFVSEWNCYINRWSMVCRHSKNLFNNYYFVSHNMYNNILSLFHFHSQL